MMTCFGTAPVMMSHDARILIARIHPPAGGEVPACEAGSLSCGVGGGGRSLAVPLVWRGGGRRGRCGRSLVISDVTLARLSEGACWRRGDEERLVTLNSCRLTER